jgi:small GTP-binding protein
MNKYNYKDFDEDFNFLFKLVILGDSGVGKSNIITRYAKNEFNLESKATIGVEFYTKLIEINDIKIKIQFWDTAGQERYRSITSAYYKGSHGILVVYDITNSDSFEHVTNWIQEIYKNVGNNIPILLVGNKSDLDYKRVISIEKSLDIANKYNLAFIEMSAMTGINIQAGIEELVKNIYDLYLQKTQNQNNIKNMSKNIYDKNNKKINIKLVENNKKFEKNKLDGGCC